MGQYADGMGQYADGMGQYADGMGQYADGMGQYADGMGQARAGPVPAHDESRPLLSAPAPAPTLEMGVGVPGRGGLEYLGEGDCSTWERGVVVPGRTSGTRALCGGGAASLVIMSAVLGDAITFRPPSFFLNTETIRVNNFLVEGL